MIPYSFAWIVVYKFLSIMIVIAILYNSMVLNKNQHSAFPFEPITWPNSSLHNYFLDKCSIGVCVWFLSWLISEVIAKCTYNRWLEITHKYLVYIYIYQKLTRSRSLTASQHHFFFNRIVRLYNSLPIIDLSLPTIKHHITNYLWTYFTNHFNSERTCIFYFYVHVSLLQETSFC